MQCSKLIWKTIPRATKLQIAKRLFSTFNLWVHVFGKLAGIENGNTKILLHAFQRIPTIGNILKRRRHGCPVLENSLGSAKTDSNDDIMCWRRGVGWANNKKSEKSNTKTIFGFIQSWKRIWSIYFLSRVFLYSVVAFTTISGSCSLSMSVEATKSFVVSGSRTMRDGRLLPIPSTWTTTYYGQIPTPLTFTNCWIRITLLRDAHCTKPFNLHDSIVSETVELFIFSLSY